MAGKTSSKGCATKSCASKKEKAPQKAAKAPAPSTEFVIQAAGASSVYLAGDFNSWAVDSPDFKLRKFKGDVWKKKVKLAPGRYEYQFVVDGQWLADPANPERTPSPYCSENSVIIVAG